MIKSMTGFGKSKSSFADGNIYIEMKTFNHKFFELSCKLPDSLQLYEDQIKKTIKKRIKRGKCYLWIQLEQTYDKSEDMQIDKKRLYKYHTLLKKIKNILKLQGQINLEQILSFPEIIITQSRKLNRKQVWRATEAALSKALNSLILMRQKEGSALYKDLILRTKSMGKSLQKIKLYLPQEIQHYKQRLKKKLINFSEKNGSREERLNAEVALFAKNCDITEELIRLKAHIDNFKSTIKKNKEAGKVLDFIAQEIQREINTVGAKSADFNISREVIFVKGEIEKIREQVQNIE
ncbi:MAG: YicC/YloC family endoribonuclease [Candidatus Omnitrophota bacterium]